MAHTPIAYDDEDIDLDASLNSLWCVSSSSDPTALAIVDGTGTFNGCGPHYSRRTPGSKTFTGVGQEIVLVTKNADAVWAVVRQRTPARRGSGMSRGRQSETDTATAYVWRNMMFRNLGSTLSSLLIRDATSTTYTAWYARYRELPAERLRTEVDTRHVKSSNPGYCYLCAGWERGPTKRRKLHLYAPPINRTVSVAHLNLNLGAD